MSVEKTANFICMKWGDKYGPEYVNRLYRMIDRNIQRDFSLTCFTDREEGIDKAVRVQPLLPLGLPEGLPERGWNKLATLAQDIGGLSGQVIFLDLDVVITGTLDDFFDYPGEFLIIRDSKFRTKPIGNSSVYRFSVGRYASVLEDFIDNFDWVRKNFRNEQAYLSYAIHKLGELEFWPKGWCPSFKYHCMKPWPAGLFLDPQLPEGSRIVIFHGHPLPQEAIDGKTAKWIRPVRPTAWVADYWLR